MLKKITSFLIFLICINANSQYYKLSENSNISLITCGSGNELYSIYGHTALRFTDIENNLDVVFNYGNFDFGTPNFYLKFVKGDLQYFVGACSFNDFMQEYRESNRAVFEQILILSSDQKQQMYEQLSSAVFSDERFYTYKFIDKNCTTMVLDKINSIYGHNIIKKNTNIENSYRTILYGFLDNHFWENFGINIIFGAKVDKPATKLFLPEELMQNLKISKFKGQLIAKNIEVLNKKNQVESQFSFWNSVYPFMIFLLLLMFINNKIINIVYFLILGFIGLFFSTVGLYSFHQEIYYNYNILFFNPLLLLLVYFIFRNQTQWILRMLYFNLICLLIYIIVLINKPHLLMMLPMILCNGFLFVKMLLSQKNLLTSVK